MEQEPRKYTVNFLDDDTTDDDAFGGHQRIADTLRDIIATTPKGKSIVFRGIRQHHMLTLVKNIFDKQFVLPYRK